MKKNKFYTKNNMRNKQENQSDAFSRYVTSTTDYMDPPGTFYNTRDSTENSKSYKNL